MFCTFLWHLFLWFKVCHHILPNSVQMHQITARTALKTPPGIPDIHPAQAKGAFYPSAPIKQQMKSWCWILTVTAPAGTFPLVLKIPQLNPNCCVLVIRHITPSQEIKRKNSFLIKTGAMKARAAQKVEISGFGVYFITAPWHPRSMCSCSKCNKGFPKCRFCSQSLCSPHHNSQAEKHKAWFYFHVETGILNTKVCWRTASHKQQKSCSEAKEM